MILHPLVWSTYSCNMSGYAHNLYHSHAPHPYTYTHTPIPPPLYPYTHIHTPMPIHPYPYTHAHTPIPYIHRPYIEMCMPSSLDPTLAPEGCHVLSLFTQYTPYHPASGPWNDENKEKYCEKGVCVCVCGCVGGCVCEGVCGDLWTSPIP